MVKQWRPWLPGMIDGESLISSVGALLLTAYSDEEWAAKTWKNGFVFYPLLGFVDHSDGCTGEPVAGPLRRGNTGSNATDPHHRPGSGARASDGQVAAADAEGSGRSWRAPTLMVSRVPPLRGGVFRPVVDHHSEEIQE